MIDITGEVLVTNDNMEGSTHYYALGIGNHAEIFKKIAGILGIEAVIVR